MIQNKLESWYINTKRNLAAACITVAALCSPMYTYAANVLLLSEPCGGSVEYAPTALANLGHTTTQIAIWDDFITELSGTTTYDLVIVESYNDNPTDITPLQTYIDNGGRAIVAYWDLANNLGLATSLDATFISEYTAPLEIQVWDSGSALFSKPTIVNNQTPLLDTCAVDGQKLEPISPATAPAGYQATQTTNEAAIVVGNNGHTVLFGFVPGLFDTTMVNLYENTITKVLSNPSSGSGAENPFFLLLLVLLVPFFFRKKNRAL